jgi:hypothetical protein
VCTLLNHTLLVECFLFGTHQPTYHRVTPPRQHLLHAPIPQRTGNLHCVVCGKQQEAAANSKAVSATITTTNKENNTHQKRS